MESQSEATKASRGAGAIERSPTVSFKSIHAHMAESWTPALAAHFSALVASSSPSLQVDLHGETIAKEAMTKAVGITANPSSEDVLLPGIASDANTDIVSSCTVLGITGAKTNAGIQDESTTLCSATLSDDPQTMDEALAIIREKRAEIATIIARRNA